MQRIVKRDLPGSPYMGAYKWEESLDKAIRFQTKRGARNAAKIARVNNRGVKVYKVFRTRKPKSNLEDVYTPEVGDVCATVHHDEHILGYVQAVHNVDRYCVDLIGFPAPLRKGYFGPLAPYVSNWLVPISDLIFIGKLPPPTTCGAKSYHGPIYDEDDPPITCSREWKHEGQHMGGTRCGTLEWD